MVSSFRTFSSPSLKLTYVVYIKVGKHGALRQFLNHRMRPFSVLSKDKLKLPTSTSKPDIATLKRKKKQTPCRRDLQ